ncbi:hypothetical protein FSP39_023265 [Pinctada imbricata]|uniref:Uncharacterized protein n=1 Tax=Pinctada imbricata TaxID=66713 RepID=A0AA88YJI3_PINIB|nr:hypothetical protein FSP39_023265 [Pinctada imbricata]
MSKSMFCVTHPGHGTKIIQFAQCVISALKVVVTNVYERVAVYATSITSFTAADICNDAVITEDRMHVALREGSETSGIITCPTTIQSTWSYEYSGMPCGSGSYVDTCTDKTMFNFNETNCNPLFSSMLYIFV